MNAVSFLLALLLCAQAHAGPILGEPEDLAGPPAVDELVIEYTHSPASNRDVTYALVRKGDHFEIDGRRVDPSLTDALLASGTTLFSSPGLQDCWDHTDDYPNYRILLRSGGADVGTFSSTSNCQSYAPWNVVYEGRLLVQYDGSIWSALGPLLQALDPDARSSYQSFFGGVSGVQLYPLGPSPDGLQVAESLEGRLASMVVASDAFRLRFPNQTPTVVRAWCRVASHPDCATLEVDVTVPRGARAVLRFGVHADAQGAREFELPADFEALDRLMASPIVSTFEELKGSPVVVSYLPEDTGSSFEWTAEASSKLDRWDASSRDAFLVAVPSEGWPRYWPSVFFYPELDLAWIQLGDRDSNRAFFTQMGAGEEVIEAAAAKSGRFFARLDGEVIHIERQRRSRTRKSRRRARSR